MRDQPPVVLRNLLAQSLLYIVAILRLDDTETLGETLYVRIDGDTLVRPKGVRYDDVRRLAPHALYIGQVIDVFRNLAVELIDDSTRSFAQMARLASVEPRRTYHLFDILLFRLSHRLRRRVGVEKSGRDRVDAFVGALRRKHRRHEELVRSLIVESRIGFGVFVFETRKYLGGLLHVQNCARRAKTVLTRLNCAPSASPASEFTGGSRLQASETTKYFIHANLRADGVVERSDVVGAIYGQTEGLLGEDLDLRDLQDSDKISRMEVDVGSSNGSSRGTVTIGSSLDRVETSVLAASLETIERIGPCEATVEVELVEDVRTTKRKEIVERAKYIHREMFDGAAMGTGEMLDEVRKGVRKGDITEYAGLPAGPNVKDSDAVLVVEGRADVLNLLKYGVKNAVGVEGTDVPDTVAELTQDRTVTAFLDSDRGGDLILKELGQVADIDYVAHPPDGRCVEDLSGEEINEALRDKRIFGGSEASDGAENGTEPAGARKTDGTESTEAGERKRTEAVETEGTGEAGEPKKADETEGEQEELPFVEKLRDADNGEAVLLDGERHEVGRVECDDSVEALRNGDGEVDSIVVGNEIDQRVLDAASQGNVETVVGSELGTVVKKPLDINIVTETELP